MQCFSWILLRKTELFILIVILFGNWSSWEGGESWERPENLLLYWNMPKRDNMKVVWGLFCVLCIVNDNPGSIFEHFPVDWVQNSPNWGFRLFKMGKCFWGWNLFHNHRSFHAKLSDDDGEEFHEHFPPCVFPELLCYIAKLQLCQEDYLGVARQTSDGGFSLGIFHAG